jgi:hypothetical protein
VLPVTPWVKIALAFAFATAKVETNFTLESFNQKIFLEKMNVITDNYPSKL